MQCIGRKCINIGTILVSLIFISCSSMLSDLKFSSQNSSNSATGLTSSAEQSQQIFSTLSFDISDSPNDAQWNEENLDTENGEISSSYVYAVTALYGTSTTDFIPTSSCMTFDSERYEFMGWGGGKIR